VVILPTDLAGIDLVGRIARSESAVLGCCLVATSRFVLDPLTNHPKPHGLFAHLGPVNE
jgi:hypothetical protein